jgi:hypothetical protein
MCSMSNRVPFGGKMRQMSNSDSDKRPDPAQNDLGPEFLVGAASQDGNVNWMRYSDENGQTLCDLDLRAPDPPSSRPAPCGDCSHSLAPWHDRTSVRRGCPQCGELQYEASATPSTGPFARKGEEIVIPVEVVFRNFALIGGGSFTRRGVAWLAKALFSKPLGLAPRRENFEEGLALLMFESNKISDQWCSPGASVSDAEKVTAEETQDRDDPANPFLAARSLANAAQRAIDAVNANPEAIDLAIAGWSTAQAAALLRFKVAFEEAAYIGNSIETIRWLLDEWARNERNDSEDFWQDLFFSRPFALSQLFSAPVVVHGDKYLVGGVRAGGQHGKIADYLLRHQMTDAAVIVEIKNPVASLLSSKYRKDVYPPSRELTGAVQQVLEQRAQFMKNMPVLQYELEASDPRVEVVEPHCVVIIGHAAMQLCTRAQRRGFEAYRTELRNVRIVTFDELFAKLRGLLGLLRGDHGSAST